MAGVRGRGPSRSRGRGPRSGLGRRAAPSAGPLRGRAPACCSGSARLRSGTGSDPARWEGGASAARPQLARRGGAWHAHLAVGARGHLRAGSQLRVPAPAPRRRRSWAPGSGMTRRRPAGDSPACAQEKAQTHLLTCPSRRASTRRPVPGQKRRARRRGPRAGGPPNPQEAARDPSPGANPGRGLECPFSLSFQDDPLGPRRQEGEYCDPHGHSAVEQTEALR